MRPISCHVLALLLVSGCGTATQHAVSTEQQAASAPVCTHAPLAEGSTPTIVEAKPMRGNRAPAYTGSAHGTVALSFLVDTLGHPIAGTLRMPAATPLDLVSAIEQVVPSWRYTAATVNGCKGAQSIVQPVQY